MNQSHRVEKAGKSGTLERKASLNQTLRSKYKRLITQVLSHLQTQEVFISFRWLPLPWSCPVPHVSTMETGLHITWKMYKALPTSVAEIGKWQLSLGKGHHGAPSYSPQRLSSYRQGSYLHLAGLLLIYPAAPRKSCLCLLTMKDSLARGHRLPNISPGKSLTSLKSDWYKGLRVIHHRPHPALQGSTKPFSYTSSTNGFS